MRDANQPQLPLISPGRGTPSADVQSPIEQRRMAPRWRPQNATQLCRLSAHERFTHLYLAEGGVAVYWVGSERVCGRWSADLNAPQPFRPSGHPLLRGIQLRVSDRLVAGVLARVLDLGAADIEDLPVREQGGAV